MTDRDDVKKLLRGLACCYHAQKEPETALKRCVECPYFHLGVFAGRCKSTLLKDALSYVVYHETGKAFLEDWQKKIENFADIKSITMGIPVNFDGKEET